MAPPKKNRVASPISDAANRWLAESIRATVFFASAKPNKLDLWKEIAGSQPDTVTEHPSQGARQSIGAFGNGVLTTNQLPGRTDIIYAPKDRTEQNNIDSPFVDIGLFSEAEKLFDEKTSSAILEAEDCIRVAYAPIVLIADRSMIDSNKVFDLFMPNLKINVETDSDISLQINRPKFLDNHDGIRINRVFKWQVTEMQLIQIATPNSIPAKLTTASMCRLDLDLSTDARNATAFDQYKLKDLFYVLKSEAKKIIMAGDFS